MKYKFFLLAIPVILLAGCAGKAVKFNNKMAEIESSARPDVESAQKKIQDYYKDQEWDKIVKEAKKMEAEMSDKISELKDLETPDAEGASAFKKAEVNFLTTTKAIFTSYRKIGEAENDQDRQTELTNLQQASQDYLDASQEVKKTQKKFAEANNVKLENQDKDTNDEKPTKKKKTDDE